MLIRCHYENDGKGIVLSEIESPADAIKVQNLLVEKGIASATIDADWPKGFRVSVASLPLNSFLRIIAGSEIELIF